MKDTTGLMDTNGIKVTGGFFLWIFFPSVWLDFELKSMKTWIYCTPAKERGVKGCLNNIRCGVYISFRGGSLIFVDKNHCSDAYPAASTVLT